MNEKTPEQIREESDAAREASRLEGVATGAIPEVEPARVVHGHPGPLPDGALPTDAVPADTLPPPADIPPATIDGDQPGDTGADSLGDYVVGDDGVRRYSGQTAGSETILGVDLGAEGGDQTFEVINGQQDAVDLTDQPATFVEVGRNSEGSYGPLGADFPFTDETTDGRVLRNDGAIVQRPALTGIADAGPYEGSPQQAADLAAADSANPVNTASNTAPDVVTSGEWPKAEDPAPEATYAGDSTPVEASAPATDEGSAGVAPDGERVADVATDSSGGYGDVAGQSFEEAQVFADNPPDADTTAEAAAEESKPTEQG